MTDKGCGMRKLDVCPSGEGRRQRSLEVVAIPLLLSVVLSPLLSILVSVSLQQTDRQRNPKIQLIEASQIERETVAGCFSRLMISLGCYSEMHVNNNIFE